MRNKLIVIFDQEWGLKVPKVLIFGNKLDAEEYFLGVCGFQSIDLQPEEEAMFFMVGGWEGTGKCIWGKEV